MPQARVWDDSSVVDSGVLVLVDAAAGDKKDGQSVARRLVVVEKMQYLEIVLAPGHQSVGVVHVHP